MIIIKQITTKHLQLEMMVTHKEANHHSIINASEESILDYNDIMDAIRDDLKSRLTWWEEKHKDRIERVGK